MVFYEIEILSVPEIIFACSVDLDKYKNQFSNRKDYIEIALCELGSILFEHRDGTKEIAHPGMLMPILSDIACNTTLYKNEKNRHITVGVNVRYNLKRYNSEYECNIDELKKRMKEKCIVLIPYHCSIEEIQNEFISIIKKIIALYSSPNPSDSINAIAMWYSLAGLLSNFVMNRLSGNNTKTAPSELIYAEKAVKYINNNYAGKLQVKDVAETLGISEGYLHRIFKNAKGCGVLEYINRYRISVAIQLVDNKNLSLKEAAYNVGIDDVAYMSRLFKKVTGLSFREYFLQTRQRTM